MSTNPMKPDDLGIEEIQKSGLFDEAWYVRTYADVAQSGLSPIEHFCWIGHRLKRDPNPQFSVRQYLADHQGLGAEGLNPLLHYLRKQRSIDQPSTQIEAAVGRRDVGRKSPDLYVASALLISGEPLDRPGALYRIKRMAEAIRASGVHVDVMDREQANQAISDLPSYSLIYIWRARHDDILDLCKLARRYNIKIIYDLDDLMVRPELATPEFIDAIRFNKHDQEQVKAHYTSVGNAMSLADYCVASTHELAWHMRKTTDRRPTHVIPNSFSRDTYQKSRAAARAKQSAPHDGKVRIGYASGSRTHQADFKICSQAVADILKKHPAACLVLFRRNTLVTLDLSEFAEFSGLEDRIEWRNFVRLEDLPGEIARFDINLAPLEVGNPFCESKSELKFFEAAIADVPTVASPTGPYRRSIEHGRTGFLADNRAEWFSALDALVGSPALRNKIARDSHRAALWMFGPVRKAELAASLLAQVQASRLAARTMRFDHHVLAKAAQPIEIAPYNVVSQYDRGSSARVTVVIPLYNYGNYIIEALESVKHQTISDIDLVIVDDNSTDNSIDIVTSWICVNHSRFNRVVLVKHVENNGLGSSRNTGFDLSDTLYIMTLDADNRLLPTCCEKLFHSIDSEKAAFAYSIIQQFGDAVAQMGTSPFCPASFIPGNTVDAMAMISKEVWSFVGGYAVHRMGWQDYDFWCRIVDAGLLGTHVDEVLCEYRVHGNSMLRTATDKQRNKAELIAQMEDRYAWLSPLDSRQGHRVPLARSPEDDVAG